MIRDINFKNLGLIEYGKAYDLMMRHLKADEFTNEIWFLEHEPVFTLGTAADKKHILNSTSIPIFQSDRGGEVTYHGPGQLVVYFMLDLKKHSIGPKAFVRELQEIISQLLTTYSIKSNFIEGAPGVYVNEKKIASIGLRFSKGKSYHGISINVDMNLDPFSNINPCGYQNLSMTQISEYIEDVTIKKVIKDISIIINKFYS
ncbi:MAG: lipoyl(octanoyl) transferase LipB [Candidatus Neomarinimicrobiota bacterium]